MPADERASLYRRIVARVKSAPPREGGLTGSDWIAATIVCIAVILPTFPAAAPFWLIDDLELALRVSNGILLALLFVSGWAWARYTTATPWKAGLAFLAGGLLLVLIAIPLGG